MNMYKFFVIQDQVKENYIEILEEDANHIGKVLRLRSEERRVGKECM